MKSKLSIAGLILLILAVLSGLMEMTFYGGIDSEGVLQESLFLPLTFICLALSVIFCVLSLIMWVKRKLRDN